MKKIRKIYRNYDVVNKKNDLEDLYQFQNFPISMGVTNRSIKKDQFFDMNWKISKSSGTIQLNPLMPTNVVYSKNHQNSGSIGNLWLLHHKSFAEFIKKFNPQEIFEIGGAHGILCKEYHKLNKKVKWTIVEPNPTVSKKIKAKIVKGFFDLDTKINQQVDTFVHSHVLEHMYDLHKFMKILNIKLKTGDKMIFSVPNLEIMLKKKFTNCINFEHTVFLNEPLIKFFLNIYNFQILEKKYFKSDHSIFYSCVKMKKKIKKNELKNNFYKKNKKMYLDYIHHHLKLINIINKKIDKTEKPIFLFGAHVFAQYLINFGLKTKKIIHILDNDKKKQNKRFYGSEFIVKSPKILSKYNNPLVILKAGTFIKEIKSDILNNINPRTQFI